MSKATITRISHTVLGSSKVTSKELKDVHNAALETRVTSKTMTGRHQVEGADSPGGPRSRCPQPQAEAE